MLGFSHLPQSIKLSEGSVGNHSALKGVRYLRAHGRVKPLNSLSCSTNDYNPLANPCTSKVSHCKAVNSRKTFKVHKVPPLLYASLPHCLPLTC